LSERVIRIDATVLVFAVLLVVATGMLFLSTTPDSPTGNLVIPPAAPMDCQFVAGTSCPGLFTKIYAMSNGTNAHAELPNETNYAVSVCCRDTTASNVISTTSGPVALHLSNFTNAHAERFLNTNYNVSVFFSSAPNQVFCLNVANGSGTCPALYGCLGTLSNETNAHVANCSAGSAYNITVCCSFGGLITAYFHPDLSSGNLLNANGSINGTLIDNETSYLTQTITYLNSTTNRRFLRFEGFFNQSDVDASLLLIQFNDTAVAINTSGVTGDSTNHSLFLPRDTVSNLGVRVCPQSLNLTVTNQTCTNGLEYYGPFPQTISNFTVLFDGGEYRIDNLTSTGAILLIIVNSTILDSNLTNSSVFNSTIINSTLNNSQVNISNITNSTIINSTIVNSSKINSTIINSTVINSTNYLCNMSVSTEINSQCTQSNSSNSSLSGSNLTNSSSVNSTIIDSNKINSTMHNSTITRSTNMNCTISGSTESGSLCINSNVTNSTLVDLTVINASIINGFCNSGTIVFRGSNFPCPIALFEFLPMQTTTDKTDSRDPVAVSDTFTYTITLTNNDNATAFNVTVNDTYPAGVTFITSSPPATVGDNFFALGNITVGQTATINITVLVNSVPNGTVLVNDYVLTHVRGSGIDFNITNSTTTTVFALPNVTTNKTDNIDPIIKGQLLNYTIFITNDGEEAAYNTTVIETYPAGTSFVNSTISPSSGNNIFLIGNISPNETANITITLLVNTSVANNTVINNTYEVNFTGFLGNQLSVSNLTNTTVLGFPDLIISKTDSPDPVTFGGTLVYTINVLNNGDETANNTLVADIFPANVSYVSSSIAPLDANSTYDLGNLVSGQSVSFTITVLAPTITSTIVNSINVSFINATGVNTTINTSQATLVVPPSTGQGGGSNSMQHGQIYSGPRSYGLDGDSILTPLLSRLDSVQFSMQDGLHTLTVLDVSASKAVVSVQSALQQFDILPDKTQTIDLTGDGKLDLRVRIVKIVQGQQVQLLIEKIKTPVTIAQPSPVVEEEIVPTLQEPAHQEPAYVGDAYQTPMQEKLARNESRKSTGFLLTAVIIFIALAILATMVWSRRRGAKEETEAVRPEQQFVPPLVPEPESNYVPEPVVEHLEEPVEEIEIVHEPSVKEAKEPKVPKQPKAPKQTKPKAIKKTKEQVLAEKEELARKRRMAEIKARIKKETAKRLHRRIN